MRGSRRRDCASPICISHRRPSAPTGQFTSAIAGAALGPDADGAAAGDCGGLRAVGCGLARRAAGPATPLALAHTSPGNGRDWPGRREMAEYLPFPSHPLRVAADRRPAGRTVAARLRRGPDLLPQKSGLRPTPARAPPPSPSVSAAWPPAVQIPRHHREPGSLRSTSGRTLALRWTARRALLHPDVRDYRPRRCGREAVT